MPDPTFTVTHPPPDSGLFAVGVKGEHHPDCPQRGPVEADCPCMPYHPPAWATAMVEERCETCGGKSYRMMSDDTPCPTCGSDESRLTRQACPDCVDGHPYHSAIGRAAPLACVPVVSSEPASSFRPPEQDFLEVYDGRCRYWRRVNGAWDITNFWFPDADQWVGQWAMILKGVISCQ